VQWLKTPRAGGGCAPQRAVLETPQAGIPRADQRLATPAGSTGATSGQHSQSGQQKDPTGGQRIDPTGGQRIDPIAGSK